MAASTDKAQGLKNAYVDGIIGELGGASDPAARMALRENDQASIHVFPGAGKTGAINDGDPGAYVHGADKSYQVDTNPGFANPINGGAGERRLIESKPETQQDGQNYLDEMERRMGGSGDLARMRPKSKEDFERKPQLLGNASFDASNLGGAMGMEQGQSATHIMDLDAGHHQYVNDGRPVMMIKRNSEVRGMRDVGSALPIKGERMGAERFVPISAQGRNAGNRAFNSGRMDHVGYYN